MPDAAAECITTTLWPCVHSQDAARPRRMVARLLHSLKASCHIPQHTDPNLLPAHATVQTRASPSKYQPKERTKSSHGGCCWAFNFSLYVLRAALQLLAKTRLQLRQRGPISGGVACSRLPVASGSAVQRVVDLCAGQRPAVRISGCSAQRTESNDRTAASLPDAFLRVP